MILYHFTTALHLPFIEQDGVLNVTESNIGSGNPHLKPFGEYVGPDVVWLTDSATIRDGTSLGLGPRRIVDIDGVSAVFDKSDTRITVAVEDAIHWPKFAADHGINKTWYRAISRADGQKGRSWWVVPRPIPRGEWLEIKRL